MERIWSAVCRIDPQEKGQPDARIFKLAVALGRGVREDNGETHYLWRAVDHEGEVLESFVTKRHGRPHILVTDKLRSCGAALKEIGSVDKQETGRWLNNRAENSH